MNFIKKISSIVLAFLLILSTISFSVEQHFCCDELVDISFFGKAETCNDKAVNSLMPCDNFSLSKKGCCSTEIKNIAGQSELQLNVLGKLQLSTSFISVSNHLLNITFKQLERNIIPHKNYIPPNLVTNFKVLYEVFLI